MGRFRFPWPRTPDTGPVTEGKIARIAAEQTLKRHQEESAQVSVVVKNLRALRTRNHFGEQIEDLIRARLDEEKG